MNTALSTVTRGSSSRFVQQVSSRRSFRRQLVVRCFIFTPGLEVEQEKSEKKKKNDGAVSGSKLGTRLQPDNDKSSESQAVSETEQEKEGYREERHTHTARTPCRCGGEGEEEAIEASVQAVILCVGPRPARQHN